MEKDLVRVGMNSLRVQVRVRFLPASGQRSERFVVGRAGNSAFRYDRSYIAVWSHIECRMRYLGLLRHDGNALDPAHLIRVALFDRDVATIRNGKIESR